MTFKQAFKFIKKEYEESFNGHTLDGRKLDTEENKYFTAMRILLDHCEECCCKK